MFTLYRVKITVRAMWQQREMGLQSVINCTADPGSTSQVGCHALISQTDLSSDVKWLESLTPAGLTTLDNSATDPSSGRVTGARQVKHTTSTTKRHNTDLLHTRPVAFTLQSQACWENERICRVTINTFYVPVSQSCHVHHSVIAISVCIQTDIVINRFTQ